MKDYVTILVSKIYTTACFSVGVLLTMCPSDLLHASDLIENSPFVPADFTRYAPNIHNLRGASNIPLSRKLEFRGVFSLSNQYYFNIYNTIDKRGDWVKLREPNAPYRVLRFEKNNDLIEIEYKGQTEKLTRIRPSGETLPVITDQQRNAAGSVVNNAALRQEKKAITNRSTPLRRRVITKKQK